MARGGGLARGRVLGDRRPRWGSLRARRPARSRSAPLPLLGRRDRARRARGRLPRRSGATRPRRGVPRALPGAARPAARGPPRGRSRRRPSPSCADPGGRRARGRSDRRASGSIVAAVTIAHWDDAPRELYEAGPLAGHWTDLGSAAGSVTVGVNRVEILPGKRSTPVHSEGEEEEIFYVLGGSGLSWQEGETYEVGPGDCLVHLASQQTHTLVAGEEGLEVLAFGMRAYAEMGYLPRAGVMRHGRATIDLSPDDRHPWEREAAAGELELPPPSPRPRKVFWRGVGFIGRIDHIDYWVDED